jgi:hypothetical protein
MAVVSGKAAFAHLDSTEVYNGQDTGRYTLTVTLDDDNAQILSEQGLWCALATRQVRHTLYTVHPPT